MSSGINKMFWAVLLAGLISSVGLADAFEVGEGMPYATIQDAIDDANDFDEVIIHEGTYAETVSILGRSNMYVHAFGTDRVTVVGGFSLSSPTSTIVCENNLGQLVHFVRSAVDGKAAVDLLSPDPLGTLLDPEDILAVVKEDL